MHVYTVCTTPVQSFVHTHYVLHTRSCVHTVYYTYRLMYILCRVMCIYYSLQSCVHTIHCTHGVMCTHYIYNIYYMYDDFHNSYHKRFTLYMKVFKKINIVTTWCCCIALCQDPKNDLKAFVTSFSGSPCMPCTCVGSLTTYIYNM